MPLQATSGAASYDAFGGGAAAVPQYIEDVFSTYLYKGTGASQTITNGIDLSTKGGMVWVKSRSNAYNNAVIDTVRGMTYSNYRALFTNLTDAQTNSFSNIMQANTDGFSYGTSGTGTAINSNGATYASWTFRKQPKFFDVVTYTGNGTSGRTIAHSLGSTPGCIIVKCLDDAPTDWAVYHRSTGATKILKLNKTDAEVTFTWWNNTAPTSTEFTVNNSGVVNGSGLTYVAYIFAHNAGGFGLSGTDNVISCGSYTGTGASGNNVTLGYEPQWILIKPSSAVDNWQIYDTMRGWPVTASSALPLFPNLSDAESAAGENLNPNATGFTLNGNASAFNASGTTYIYIAIRRGPMKVPTSGTSVFFPQAYADASLGSTNPVLLGASTGFPVDMMWDAQRNQAFAKFLVNDRLRGSGLSLVTAYTDAEGTSDGLTGGFATMNGALANGTDAYYSSSALGRTFAAHFFRRAPSFFDEVCYTGTGTAGNITHNLGVAPEMVIVKGRSYAGTNWFVAVGNTNIYLNLTVADQGPVSWWGPTTYQNPTSTTFSIGNQFSQNGSGEKFVAYLFATCAGVSKVGSYTGTGTTKQIDCGFTGGARFVLIKKTSGTGSWYVWDSARGIVSGNDPYLLLNSTAAEVTNTDYIDTYSAGFEISSTAPSEINENGGSFIFLAIA